MSASQVLQTEGQNLFTQANQNLPFLMSMVSGGGASTSGAGGGTTKTDQWGQPIGGTTGAYGLSPVFQSQLEALSAPINAARKTALQAAKGSLSARGLGNAPGAAKALEQYINASAEQDLTGARNQVMQAQQASYQQAIQNALQMIGMGGNLITGNVNTLQNQAQAATQRTNQANADLFGAIGLGFQGANLLGGKKAAPDPSTASTSSPDVPIPGTPGSQPMYPEYNWPLPTNPALGGGGLVQPGMTYPTVNPRTGANTTLATPSMTWPG